ncbi:Tms1p [Saccharomyces cerevisiae x Saccharomyces kudriavzevii VIN7]|uniref:Tms1p n=1 Tax=Saccharomyces cerevisiae x Saccharomyces kudriavzevii (strain VIN7) TaxID=1095631 RepID=H0GSQ5_SACCK|nr:Tms1p [Saccharomyces cerevisiae x Saccharomyces kudriavzevii VIN7]
MTSIFSFSKWVSVPSGAIFILVGLILLVDFAHEWAETCISHVESEDEDSSFWQRFLVLGTTSMYTASIIMTVVMYVMFCHQQCNMNQTAVTVNLILTVITLILSVNPKIQEANPKSGLAQSSMVSVYCTYLTMSAMSSEPDDKMCNPLVRSSGTRKFSIILGSLFTFVAIAYTTTRAAANSAFQGTNTNGAIYLGNDIEYEGLGGQTRNQLRYEAIKQAVEEGSLPESALYDTAWLGTPSSTEGTIDNQNDDERTGTKYNYTLFHIIFFLATQWIAILLTINVTQDDVGDFIPVGRTYFYSWVKIVSAWICYALYGWTVVAPAVMPDRFGYENYY